MSISFISGKPGGGKTLYAVKLLLAELIHGDRPIITNVALKLPELNQYLNNLPTIPKWMEEGVALSERVILISEEELSVFFTIRPKGVRIADVSNEQWRQGKRPDYSVVQDRGVLYVLDEVHIGFNARQWADTGHQVLYYLSQHRKLGDDVIAVTQMIANVDKQFRSMSQDYTYIRNLKKERAGLFRMPGVFVRRTFPQPATDTSRPMETGTFTLDVSGIAQVYDTAKGVGIHGRSGADTKHKTKGLHWGWFALGIPLLLVMIFVFVPRTLARVLTPAIPANYAVQNNVKTPVKTVVQSLPLEKVEDVNADGKKGQIVTTNEPLRVVGVALVNGTKTIVIMSDGKTYRTGDGALQAVTKDYVWLKGVKYERN